MASCELKCLYLSQYFAITSLSISPCICLYLENTNGNRKRTVRGRPAIGHSIRKTVRQARPSVILFSPYFISCLEQYVQAQGSTRNKVKMSRMAHRITVIFKVSVPLLPPKTILSKEAVDKDRWKLFKQYFLLINISPSGKFALSSRYFTDFKFPDCCSWCSRKFLESPDSLRKFLSLRKQDFKYSLPLLTGQHFLRRFVGVEIVTSVRTY